MPGNLRKAFPYRGPVPAQVPVGEAGQPVQFNLGAFDMPVVSESVASVFAKWARDTIELFPVTVDEQADRYQIMNVTCAAPCVDDQRSDILRWKPDDERPDKIGSYRAIYRLIIDPSRARGKHVFRIQGWEIALIVSEQIREKLARLDDLGVVFRSVTGSEPTGGLP
jgi:hypothetical protein